MKGGGCGAIGRVFDHARTPSPEATSRGPLAILLEEAQGHFESDQSWGFLKGGKLSRAKEGRNHTKICGGAFVAIAGSVLTACIWEMAMQPA